MLVNIKKPSFNSLPFIKKDLFYLVMCVCVCVGLYSYSADAHWVCLELKLRELILRCLNVGAGAELKSPVLMNHLFS